MPVKTYDADPVIGATITSIRPMTKAEADRESWFITGRHGAPLVLVLSTGAILYPSRDEEGNGPGALFGAYQGQGISFERK